MKVTMAVLICSVLVILSACRDEPPTPPPAPPQPQVETQPQQQPVAASETSDGEHAPSPAAREESALKKEELVAAAKRKLDELEVRTAELRQQLAEKSEGWSAESKARWEQAMTELERQKERAKVKWEEVKVESGPALADARKELEEAMDKTAELFRRIGAKLRSEEPSK